MNRDEIVRQARIGGMARVDGEWRFVVAIDAVDDLALGVKMPNHPCSWVRADRVSDIRPSDTHVPSDPMHGPDENGPEQTVSDEPAAPSLFDLAEQVARWQRAAGDLYDFVQAAQALLKKREAAAELLRDGGAR